MTYIKKAKESNSSIKKMFVKELFDKQQGIQMTNRKVSNKEFLPIYSDMPYSFQIDLTFLPRYKNKIKGIMFCLQQFI